MSMVRHDSAEKSIVSFIGEITVCWHFTGSSLRRLSSLQHRIYNLLARISLVTPVA